MHSTVFEYWLGQPFDIRLVKTDVAESDVCAMNSDSDFYFSGSFSRHCFPVLWEYNMV